MNAFLWFVLPSLALGLAVVAFLGRHDRALRSRLMSAVLLPILCFGILSEAALAYDYELIKEDDGDIKRIAVQVASSSSRANCETCIGRLNKAGYNAYLYRPSGSKSYKIMIGAFSSKTDAKNYANFLHHQPAVKGVDLAGAYATNVYLSSRSVSCYAEPDDSCSYTEEEDEFYEEYYDDDESENNSRHPSPEDIDLPVDLFLQSECDTKIISVQVAASTSRSNCETCVRRLRKAGLNAFLYKASGSKNYRILIGIFDNVSEAESFAEVLHEAEPVKGVSLAKAYATNARITSEEYENYLFMFW